ncbi:MAG: pyridoxamine 5'-phosphate oxidase family protein [Candidatus Methylomirabilia bacterium]
MSRSLGAELPSDLLARLSQADLPHHLATVLPLITVDPGGFPHPMLLSSLEVRAVDPETIRTVIGARSRSARNLLERPAATLLIIEPDRTVYVKARATDGPYPVTGLPDVGLFVLSVEDVLEDAPQEWEGGMRITGAATYAPAPSLDEPRARATLDALSRGPGDERARSA